MSCFGSFGHDWEVPEVTASYLTFQKRDFDEISWDAKNIILNKNTFDRF